MRLVCTYGACDRGDRSPRFIQKQVKTRVIDENGHEISSDKYSQLTCYYCGVTAQLGGD